MEVEKIPADCQLLYLMPLKLDLITKCAYFNYQEGTITKLHQNHYGFFSGNKHHAELSFLYFEV